MQEQKDLKQTWALFCLVTIFEIFEEVPEKALLHLPNLLVNSKVDQKIFAAVGGILETVIFALRDDLDFTCIPYDFLAVQGKARNPRNDLEFLNLVHMEVYRWIEERAASLNGRCEDGMADHVFGGWVEEELR